MYENRLSLQIPGLLSPHELLLTPAVADPADIAIGPIDNLHWFYSGVG